MTGDAIVIRGDAANLPLPDESVDLIVTSPPYFALRSYRDAGEHYGGQIGSEATPQEFLESLWACTREWWRVLKPGGSLFVNLGDKRAGSGGHNNSGLPGATSALHPKALQTATEAGQRREVERTANRATRRNAPDRYNQSAFGRPKSKMLLPHRYATGCEDGLADPQGIGWVMRQDLIWQKLNGLPESVTDRHRDSHEYIFHLTKQERYFAAMDEIRQAQTDPYDVWKKKRGDNPKYQGSNLAANHMATQTFNPLGKLPGSVWPMASEPLLIPQWAKDKYGLGDHFAAFPTELPRKLILGFSPSGICVECGEGRRPVVDKKRPGAEVNQSIRSIEAEDVRYGATSQLKLSGGPLQRWRAQNPDTIIGYACACTPYTDHPGSAPDPEAERGTPAYFSKPAWREYHLDRWTPPSTRPATVLDPFGGTGTTALVAKSLGRIGISVDLSSDYCALADWRIHHSGHGKKAEQRTWGERQGVLA